ncbi:cupin domain-containing protein [Streptomyces sp. 900105755]
MAGRAIPAKPPPSVSAPVASRATRSTTAPADAGSWTRAGISTRPCSALVEPPVSGVQVIRAGEGPTVASERADFAATLLSSSPPGVRRDIYHLRMEPGVARESEPHIPGTVEHLVVCGGRVKAGPRGETVELNPGDLTYRGDVPHLYEALAAGTTFVPVMQHV